jgi:hypothetical protein
VHAPVAGIELTGALQVQRIEALAPDGDGEFIPENVNYGLFAHPADQLYYYANLQLGGGDVSDFRRYGNMRPESFMTEEQLKNQPVQVDVVRKEKKPRPHKKG